MTIVQLKKEVEKTAENIIQLLHYQRIGEVKLPRTFSITPFACAFSLIRAV